MKKNIQSYNSRLVANLQQLFIPTLPQIFLDLVVAAVLLAVLSGRTLWDYFIGDTTILKSSIITIINGQNTEGLYEFLDKLTHGRWIQIAFWLFVGCVVYILVWFVGTILINIRNDILAAKFVHPPSYSRTNYWESIIGRKVLLICLVVVLLGYISVFLKVGLLLSTLGFLAVTDFKPLQSSAEIISSIVVAAIMLQIWWMLGRLTLNSWRLVYKDL